MTSLLTSNKEWDELDIVIDRMVESSRINQQTTKTNKLIKSLKIKRHEKTKQHI